MEWDIVHQSDPGLRDAFSNAVWVLEDGTRVQMVSDEKKADRCF